MSTVVWLLAGVGAFTCLFCVALVVWAGLTAWRKR